MQDRTVPHAMAAAKAAATRQLTPSATGPHPADARFSAGIAAFFRGSRESRIAQQCTPNTPKTTRTAANELS